MKNTKKKRLQPFLMNAFSVAIISFILTYLITSTSFWIYNSFTFNGGLGIHSRLNRFVDTYTQSLKKDIFSTTFNQAQHCTQLYDISLMKCRGDVTRAIGNILYEEELADAHGYGWPHDLFFVKQIGNSFYRLGWDGEIKDISSVVNQSALRNSSSFVSVLLRRNCNVFLNSAESYACEVFRSVDLGNESKGYVVRLIPFEEESEVFFIVFTPLISLFILLSSSIQLIGTEQIIFVLLLILNIVGPFIASFITLYFYKKNKP